MRKLILLSALLVSMAAAGNSQTNTGGSVTGTAPIVVTNGVVSCPTCGTSAPTFDTIGSGTNATAAMVLGTGSSLTVSGSGTNNATTLNGATFAAPGAIGGGTASTGAFSTISATGAITSTLATGTAPFTVASTTNVANLNASSLGGATMAAPGAIGGTTPAAGSFSSLNCGVSVTTSCVISGFGSTSGSATITWPAVAGTAGNAIIFTNTIQSSAGVTAGTDVLGGQSNSVGINGRSRFRSAADGRVTINASANGASGLTRLTFGTEAANQPAFVFDGSTAVVKTADGSGTTANGIFSSAVYKTDTNCSSGASPAVCGAAASGSVAVPAGTNPTLVVNTTAVTANSLIFLTEDEGLGTKLGVTCQTAVLPTATFITARTAATSFTFQANGVFTTNPVCYSYLIIN